MEFDEKSRKRLLQVRVDEDGRKGSQETFLDLNFWRDAFVFKRQEPCSGTSGRQNH